METREISFLAWILTGNALNLLLRGVPADAFADGGVRDRLQRLEETLKDLPPDRTAAGILAMTAEEKTLLATACRQAIALAGDDMESLLGLLPAEAEGVLQWFEPQN